MLLLYVLFVKSNINYSQLQAKVAELADALDLGSSG